MYQSIAKNILKGRSLFYLSIFTFIILFHSFAPNTFAQTSFVQQAKLLASDGAGTGDSHGFSTAISGDYAIVGAPRNGVVGFQSRGAAYIYVRNGTTWTQQQKLIPSDGVTTDQFGYSVAINGNTAAVGRYNTTTGQNRADGKVYIFTRTGTTWTETQILVSNDIAQGDSFGYSLAFEADTLAVGARNKVINGTLFQGAAYIFTRPAGGGNYTQQAKLTASDGGQADFFGESVSLSGDTALIGSVNDFGQANARGKAYVFVRSGSSWTEQQILQSTGGASNDTFGATVSVSGNSAVIGSNSEPIGTSGEVGAAYVFTRNGTVWTQQQRFTALESTPRNDRFGYAVAIKGDTIAIGSPAHEFVASIANHGAVYVYRRSAAGGLFTRTDKVIHTDVAPDALGTSVAFDGESIISGAPSKDSARGAAYIFNQIATNGQSKLIGGDFFANVNTGQRTVAISDNTALTGNLNFGTYLFERTGANWSFIRKLTATVTGGDTAPFTNGGAAILGDVMVVGSPGSRVSNVNGAGAVYIFNRVGGVWTDVQRLLPSDAATDQCFGCAIAMTANTIVVGAENKNEGSNLRQGAVYVYVLNGSTWTFQQKLTASDGAAQDNFAQSVAIHGDTIVVGSPNDDTGAILNHGSVYAFTRTGATWTQQPKFTAADNADSDRFGRSIGIDEQTFVAGAPGADIGQTFGAGAAYAFNRMGATFTEAQKFTSGEADGFIFGESVAISGGNLIIGSPRSDDTTRNVTNNGAIVVYRKNGATFSRRGRLLAFDRAGSDQLGSFVGISGNYVIGSAPFADVFGQSNIGASYVFDLSTTSFGIPSLDFDGDGKADFTVFRPSNANWYLSQSSNNQFSATAFGVSSDVIVPADYDGDGKTDYAVFRNGVWYLLRSTSGFAAISFGQTGDIPIPADFDGDGKADICVFRPSSGIWYRLNSSDNQFAATAFGTNGDKPVIGDFDGDSKADIAVFRPSTGSWFRLNSSDNQFVAVNFGIAADQIVPADYDGDGKTDIAVFRAGIWYRLNSSNNQFIAVGWGISTDKPVPADFDGDGKIDLAVFRDGSWYVLQSSNSALLVGNFGTSGDLPIANAFVR